MPHLIHLAMNPPRFIRGGTRIRIRPRRARSDYVASFVFDDEQRRIDDARAERRDLEREGR